MIFYYHPQHRALVFPTQFQVSPDGRIAVGGHMAMPVQILREWGWKGSDADYARTLPLIDEQPRLAIAKDMREVAALSQIPSVLKRTN